MDLEIFHPVSSNIVCIGMHVQSEYIEFMINEKFENILSRMERYVHIFTCIGR